MNVNYVRFIFYFFFFISIHLFIYEKFTRTESANEPKNRNAPCQRERQRDMLIVRRWVTVRFVHIIFTKLCVRCADAVCVNHILGNLEKVWFNRIRKSESTQMKCESGKWRTGDRWQGGKYFHVKQQKYNLITPEELAALAESMLTKKSTNYRFFFLFFFCLSTGNVPLGCLYE